MRLENGIKCAGLGCLDKNVVMFNQNLVYCMCGWCAVSCANSNDCCSASRRVVMPLSGMFLRAQSVGFAK